MLVFSAIWNLNIWLPNLNGNGIASALSGVPCGDNGLLCKTRAYFSIMLCWTRLLI